MESDDDDDDDDGTTFCMHCHSASARIKVSNIVIIRRKLSLSCSICDFIKHKGSF